MKEENLVFRPLRKSHAALSEEATKAVLKNSEYGIFGTIGEHGYPHTVPINYVYMNDCIYFHCAKEGHKIDNIEKNNKVSFTAVGYHKVLADKFDSEYESAIIFGRAIEVYDQEKEAALLEMIHKYSPAYLKAGQEYIDRAKNHIKIIKIEVDHLAGKFYRD